MTWPPFKQPSEGNNDSTADCTQEEKKEEPEALSGSAAVDEVFKNEMGFALVMDALIKSKKPLIGHNCLYDWLYIYNQFVAPLPENYSDFIKDWNSKFPVTFDNKVLAYTSKLFYKTGLGDLYEKCTNDDKFKQN